MADELSRVLVIPCDNYDEEMVYRALKRGLKQLGGIEQFVSKDEKILVKPNFLTASDESTAVTTHPSVIKGVLRILSEAGCSSVKFGDSPGHGSCEAAAEKIGLKPENTYGAELALMKEEVLTKFSEGLTANEFWFAKEVTEADAIINVCKMKTHALERITGAVKNVYGLICGYRKAKGHVKFPNAGIFARMLCDIHRCVKPRLHIMDGIVAMEGNGPGSGTPINMNVLLISADPVALDTVFCYLVNLKPELVPTNAQGYAMGIGTYKKNEIEVNVIEDDETVKLYSMEELFERFGNGSYDCLRESEGKSLLSRLSEFVLKNGKRPKIDKDKCIKCGICVSHCPVPGKAVNFTKGKNQPPEYDYKKCIRCYCCQEMCPKHAISVKKRK